MRKTLGWPNAMIMTGANKQKSTLMLSRSGKLRRRVMDRLRDPEAQGLVALTSSYGLPFDAGADAQTAAQLGQAFSGALDPAALRDSIITALGAYRTGGWIGAGASVLSTALTQWLAAGRVDDDWFESTQNFHVMGQLTIRCAVYEYARVNELTIN